MDERELPAGVESLIVAPTRELGDGFHVRRALPTRERRMVGPFVFLDQMGPADFQPGRGLDVRPHPHIGLATVTYLFEGEILHRDSLGTVQRIRPGAVNWMTAGRGIAHSERTPPELRSSGGRVCGLQIWVALPQAHEEDAPAFLHYPAETLPEAQDAGRSVRVVVGELEGLRSPVQTLWETLYVDARLAKGARLPLPRGPEERALYVVEGTLSVEPDEGGLFRAGELVVLKPGAGLTVKAAENARFVLLGGAPMDGPRHIRWNFVSSSRDRIAEASREWHERRFPAVPGETEFIPLPDDLRPVAPYP